MVLADDVVDGTPAIVAHPLRERYHVARGPHGRRPLEVNVAGGPHSLWKRHRGARRQRCCRSSCRCCRRRPTLTLSREAPLCSQTTAFQTLLPSLPPPSLRRTTLPARISSRRGAMALLEYGATDPPAVVAAASSEAEVVGSPHPIW